MIRRAAGLAIVAGGIAASPALAQQWTLSGTATARAGYEVNPYLQSNDPGGAGMGGLTVTATAAREAARSTTTLIGSADVGRYTSDYGTNTNFLASLSRLQRLSEHLQVQGVATYQNTLNPQSNFGFDPSFIPDTQLDYLTVGTRTRRIDGQLFADWQVGARDSLRLGGNASHASYSGAASSDYDQYGGNLGYLHTLDARTRVGLQLTATNVKSSGFPSSQAYQAMLQVVREISPHWTFDGGVGAVKQVSGGFVNIDKITLAFQGSLCGTYPRADVCITMQRTAAPSGIGGLRTDTPARISGGYDLSERSRVTFSGAIDISSGGLANVFPKQRYFDVTLGYSRQIARRISVGGSGRYQRRETEASGLFPARSPTGYALYGTVSYSFGRLSR